MLPVKKFSDVTVATEINDSTLIFCVISGNDRLITLSTLRNYLGVVSTGGGSTGNPLLIANNYSGLSTLGEGSEYYEEPYIYKRLGTGIVRINPDTEFSTPLNTTFSGGIVVSTYSQLLTSNDGFEYHDEPYVYKKYSSGVARISCNTSFTDPTGVGTTTGIVFSTYSGLLASSLYGYEYHESPYIYKRTLSGAFQIDCTTDFSYP